MRARNIKPGFFKNPDLASLPIEHRMLFQGLWCLADCEGRLKDDHRLIKVEVFPYDNFQVDQMLVDLENSPGNFITRYKQDGIPVIQINNFSKHQNPHKSEREKGSQLPAYVESTTISTREIYGTSTEKIRPCTELAVLNPESLFLIPERGKKKTSEKVFSEDDLQTAKFISEKIKLLDPKAKAPKLENWANTIRLMREVDGRSDEEIRDVFAWANRNSFWSVNILSPDKLRDKFQTLTLQMISNARAPTTIGHQRLNGNEIVPSDQRKGGLLEI